MSDAARALAATQMGSVMPRARRQGLNPLEAIERGFALFQFTFAREAWRYYLGAAPLVLIFIPVWVLDGQIRISNAMLLLQSALLTAAYVLRVRMVANYMQRVRQRAYGIPAPKPSGVMARMAAAGRLLAWKITLSAAVLCALLTAAGASWLYGASQFATLEATEDATERHSLPGCLGLSSRWFAGGLLLFLMLFPLWVAVFLNGLLLALAVPQLLHAIFGVSTLLSTRMGVDSLIRSSAFWLALFGGAWVALDPIVKCSYVVVYQHLRSRREGDDLRGLLASLPREQQEKERLVASTGIGRGTRIGAAGVLAVVLLGVSPSVLALQVPQVQSNVAPSGSAQPARVVRLREAIDRESQREIYRWHDADHPAPPTWFDRMLEKLGRFITRAWNALLNFLRKWWPRGLTFSPGNTKGTGWRMKDLRFWIALIASLTLLAGAVLLWLRRRIPAQVSIPMIVAPLPDLSDTTVATQHSEDEWFTLATRLESEGELRLALRAAYLGLLAGLTQREWLTIRRDRTNREYLDEFTRRWRRRPQAALEARAEIPETLRGSFRLFDRVWYGMHTLTPAVVAAYRVDQRELLKHV